VLVAGGCQDDEGYGEATERAFLRACVQDGDATVREVCECSYRAITREIPFSRYRAIDRRVRDDPGDLPDEVVDIVAECGAAQGGDDEG
jgi:hypothetical protein